MLSPLHCILLLLHSLFPLSTSFPLYICSLSALYSLPPSLYFFLYLPLFFPLFLPLFLPLLLPPTCHFPFCNCCAFYLFAFCCRLRRCRFVSLPLFAFAAPTQHIYPVACFACLPSLPRSSCVYFLFYISSRARITVTQKRKRSTDEAGHAYCAYTPALLCPYLPLCLCLLCTPPHPSLLSPVDSHPFGPCATTLVKGKNLLCLIIIFLLTIRDAYAKKDNPS